MCECGMEVKAGDISCPRCGSLSEGYYGVDPDGRWSDQVFGSVEDAQAVIQVIREGKKK